MALAYLSRKLQENSLGCLKFKAFVVDHCARKDSSKEANAVAASLRNIGQIKVQQD